MPNIKVNSTSIYYEVTGKGLPLVFMHAGGMESSFWNAQVSYFSKKYRVITYDLRGHGWSDNSEGNYTVEDCVKDLYHLLNRLYIRKTYLAGLSMGGYIALNFTLCYPERVDALILAGTNSGPVTDTVVKMREEMADRIKATKGADLALNYLMAYEANTDRPDLTDRLSEINKPVLIIVGDRDIAAPLYISEEMHRRIANSQIAVISDCGHRCSQEQPDIYNSIVGDFLQRVEAIQASPET